MIRQSRPSLLLTRPLAQSLRFAGEVTARFGAMDAVISPLLAPRFLSVPLPSNGGDVIFTSETGVAGALAAGMQAQGQTAYCVGARTAAAAQQAGFAARDAGGDWRDVVALIGQKGAPKSLTLLCAAEAAPHLQLALRQAGHSVQRIEVYAQDPLPLTVEAQTQLSGNGPFFCQFSRPVRRRYSARRHRQQRLCFWRPLVQRWQMPLACPIPAKLWQIGQTPPLCWQL